MSNQLVTINTAAVKNLPCGNAVDGGKSPSTDQANVTNENGSVKVKTIAVGIDIGEVTLRGQTALGHMYGIWEPDFARADSQTLFNTSLQSCQ